MSPGFTQLLYKVKVAEVPVETRKVLLGHRDGNITTYHSVPALQELIHADNRVCRKRSGEVPAG